MESNEGEIRNDTSIGPEVHTVGLDDKPHLSLLDLTMASGNAMGSGELRHLLTPDTQAPLLLYYMDVLKRTRWKAYHTVNKDPNTGHYLDVL